MANPFLNPQNEKSFSAIVDGVVLETGRPDNFLTALQFVNLTIRECQSMGLFPQDRIEDQIVVDAIPFIWTRPPYFRSLGAVKYGCGVYPKFRVPGSSQQDECYYYYAADDYFVFTGVTVGDKLNLMMYMHSKPLMYYSRLGVDTTAFFGGPYATRLAYFDIATDLWMYLNGTSDGYVATTGDVNVDAARRKLSGNWLTKDWTDLISNGAKAKVFAQFGDTDRANRAYAAYKTTQKLLSVTGGFEAEFAAQ